MTQGDDTPKAPEDAPEDYLNAANDAAADFAADMAAEEPGLDAAKSAATALADRVAELEAEAVTLKEDRLRALAEAENARRGRHVKPDHQERPLRQQLANANITCGEECSTAQTYYFIEIPHGIWP